MLLVIRSKQAVVADFRDCVKTCATTLRNSEREPAGHMEALLQAILDDDNVTVQDLRRPESSCRGGTPWPPVVSFPIAQQT